MSQEQATRMPVSGRSEDDAIKYGDVFEVEGDIADEAIKPRDAAMMQAAEHKYLGATMRDGAAAVMQSAADLNEQSELVGHDDVSSPAKDQGVDVTQDDVLGARIVTESVAGHTVAQFAIPTPLRRGVPGAGAPRSLDHGEGAGVGATSRGGGASSGTPSERIESGDAVEERKKGDGVAEGTKGGGSVAEETVGGDAVTIGEALEAAAPTVGDKPVEKKDAAAIMTAESRAAGSTDTRSGGIGAVAQSAAADDKSSTKLGNVLSDATEKMERDKPATRDDVAWVAAAEMRNDPEAETRRGGVADGVRAAAGINQS